MKFLCLSYWDQRRFDLMSESEREIFVKECFAYDKILRRDGHFVRLEALQSARTAKILRHQNGKVSITDGPYAETKEQLGRYCLTPMI